MTQPPAPVLPQPPARRPKAEVVAERGSAPIDRQSLVEYVVGKAVRVAAVTRAVGSRRSGICGVMERANMGRIIETLRHSPLWPLTAPVRRLRRWLLARQVSAWSNWTKPLRSLSGRATFKILNYIGGDPRLSALARQLFAAFPGPGGRLCAAIRAKRLKQIRAAQVRPLQADGNVSDLPPRARRVCMDLTRAIEQAR
jgi:hypothetical protein